MGSGRSESSDARSSGARDFARRVLAALRLRRADRAKFAKAFPDYVLGDDEAPSEHDRARRSATWTPARARVSAAPAPPALRDDDYVDFMRGKRAARYLSFDDAADIDLSAPPGPAKRRLSRRWSDVVSARRLTS